MSAGIRRGLKEWSVVVEALREGRQILLLRKGGIQDREGRFASTADEFFFIPGFEHQKAELLKPEEAHRLDEHPAAGTEPGMLSLGTLGRIEEDLVLADPMKASLPGNIKGIAHITKLCFPLSVMVILAVGFLKLRSIFGIMTYRMMRS